MREFYGSIRGRISDVNHVAKRALLQPIGCDYFAMVKWHPSDLDPATTFPEFVEVMGTVSKDDNDRCVCVLAEQVRPLPEPELSWTDLFGYIPEITGGLSLDEFMARLRSDDE